MYCKNCGEKIDSDSRFCSFCGKKQPTNLKPQSLSNTQYVFAGNESEKDCLPTPNNNDLRSTFDEHIKYDPDYKRDYEKLYAGFLLLLLSSLTFFFMGQKGWLEHDGQYATIIAFASILVRVVVIFYVVKMAKTQNRNTFVWGFFAFLLPGLTLIISATRKKLFANIQIIEGLDARKNSSILTDEAKQYYDQEKYAESVRFSRKALELDPKNETAKKIFEESQKRVHSEAYERQFAAARSVRTVEGKLLRIVTKNDPSGEADVFIDTSPAPDGTYTSSLGKLKLVIKNGKIKNEYFIVNYKNLIAEQVKENILTVGDRIYLPDGNVAPDGIYKTGFNTGKIAVEDGRFAYVTS